MLGPFAMSFIDNTRIPDHRMDAKPLASGADANPEDAKLELSPQAVHALQNIWVTAAECICE
jgi:hypothetical protein